mmetsp:Transcript_81316/g.205466  ORF Transcript_81316/g.205466 Transcript_81316/m.205466 type:complete len:204 (+) Transcript_81316:283-894(+)
MMAWRSDSMPASSVALLSCTWRNPVSPTRRASSASCKQDLADAATTAAPATRAVLALTSSAAVACVASASAKAACKAALEASTSATLSLSESAPSLSVISTPCIASPIILTASAWDACLSSLGVPKACGTQASSILRQPSGRPAACSKASITPVRLGSAFALFAAGAMVVASLRFAAFLVGGIATWKDTVQIGGTGTSDLKQA